MSQERLNSIQRFKRLTTDLQRDVKAESVVELNASADELVEQMQAVAPLGPTGNLRKSIRKEPGKSETRVLVKAGGPLTTVRSRGGAPPYDYTNAIEFGTQGTPAHPFFWPSWRLRRRRIRSRMRRRITANIKRKSA